LLKGNKLREWRLERGLAAQDVADRLSLSRTFVYQHEMGGMKNPPMRIVNAYAELYNQSPGTVRRELTRPQKETGSKAKLRKLKKGKKP